MNCEDVALAFVGTVVPDLPRFRNRAFSRAGNMFQENLVKSLSRAGLRPSLILSQRPLRLYPRSNSLLVFGESIRLTSGQPVRLVPFVNLMVLRMLTVGLAVVWGLVRWAWRNRHIRQKVVLVYNLTEPPGLFVWLGAKLIGAKAVVSVNDINIPGQTITNTLARRVDFQLQKLLVPRFDGLLVVNRKIVEDFAPKSPFLWNPGGGTEDFLRSSPISGRGSEKEGQPFVIAFAGMLTEVNGIPELLDAFSLLEDDGREYRLRIAGKGDLELLVKEAALADPRIDFLGYVTFEEVINLYATADLLVNMRITRRIKTDYFFPSKLLEYMSTGIPTVTTSVGHIEEFADSVFLLQEETAEGLADKIRCVAAQDIDQRYQMGQRAKNYMLEKGTWEAKGHRIADFIRSQVLS
jgi:glycosyltransferase involved in cell wall biosynthesis